MNDSKGRQKLLPRKYLRKACLYGSLWCATILLWMLFRWTVTVTLLVTTYIVWTKRMLLLFGMQTSLLIGMVMQICAYARFCRRREHLRSTDLLKGLRLLKGAYIGKVVWCVLAIVQCGLIAGSQQLLNYFQEEMYMTSFEMIWTVGCLVCLLLLELSKLVVLHRLPQTLSGQSSLPSWWMRAAACATIGQYVVPLLFVTVLLLCRIGWIALAAVVPFAAMVFLGYYYAACCYMTLSRRVGSMVVRFGPTQE